MGHIPEILVDYINDAFPENVCLVAITMADGFAQVSPRGSTLVYDENTLAIWERGKGNTNEALQDGTKMTVYYRNRALGGRGGNGLLKAGGIARFYGTAEIHREEGEVREKVWNQMHEAERNNDPDKKGYPVLIRLDRAETLTHSPLNEIKMPEE